MYLNALLFITIFAVIFFILKKSPFRENAAVCWIISLCVSAFSIYGILSSGFSFEELLYSLGLNSDILPTLLAMVGVVIVIFLILKFGFRKFLVIIFTLIGTLLIALSLFGVIYQKAAGIIIGAILLILALVLKKKDSGRFHIKLPGIKFRGGARMLIYAEGKRYTSPIFRTIPMTIQVNRGSRIAVENDGDKPLIWLIKTRWGLRASPTRGIVEPGNANEIKIYSDSSTGTKQALVVGKSQGSFSKQRARLSINAYPQNSTPPSFPGPKGPPRGPSGAARFDLVVGNKSYSNPDGTLNSVNLGNSNQLRIVIKNGGTGGTLSWKAAVSKGMKISRSSGGLKAGKSDEINVEILNRSTPNQRVTIFAKRGADKGARDLIRKAISKVRIPIE